MWKCFYVSVKHNQLQTLQHTHLYQFQHKMHPSGDNTVSLKITHHSDPADVSTSLDRV
jgi:hypothetical protein